MSSQSTTLLPPSTAAVRRRGEKVRPKLALVSPARMAEAEEADREFCALAEEVSRVVRKPAAAPKHKRPGAETPTHRGARV